MMNSGDKSETSIHALMLQMCGTTDDDHGFPATLGAQTRAVQPPEVPGLDKPRNPKTPLSNGLSPLDPQDTSFLNENPIADCRGASATGMAGLGLHLDASPVRIHSNRTK